jgi:hypothetical protein
MRFCVGFGFEPPAAANEEAIVLSLGPPMVADPVSHGSMAYTCLAW